MFYRLQNLAPSPRGILVLALGFAATSTQDIKASSNNRCYTMINNLHLKPQFTEDSLLIQKDRYLWDNWIVYDGVEKQYLRYSLSAPRSVGDNSMRHKHARLRVFSSPDGKTWTDRGLLVNDGLTWSGQTIQNKDGSFTLLVTKAKHLDNQDVHQKFAIAHSKDGVNFGEAQTLLDPWSPAWKGNLEKAGYHLGPADGGITSWRDPHLFEDVLYFGARKKKANGDIVLAVGRLEYPNADLSATPRILEPLELPIEKSITELEVPNMKQLEDGRYLLSVNMSDRASPESKTMDINTWVRFYVSESKAGPWTPAKAPQLDEMGNLYGASDRVYGFNLLQGLEPGEIKGAGFLRSGNENDHALTPIVSIDIE